MPDSMLNMAHDVHIAYSYARFSKSKILHFPKVLDSFLIIKLTRVFAPEGVKKLCKNMALYTNAYFKAYL